MDDKEYQLKTLDQVFMSGAYPIVFKNNPKYDLGGNTPYIALSDVIDLNYIIRASKSYDDKSDQNKIIVKCSSLKEIVEDGWRLD
ncbi:MAG TPA: hypothetical protein EYM84_02685 [Flavobacteriales bacterium]|nr:hypothetical protein [Flavobacteriales bacterium]